MVTIKQCALCICLNTMQIWVFQDIQSFKGKGRRDRQTDSRLGEGTERSEKIVIITQYILLTAESPDTTGAPS